jgi:hypothetical protein
MSVEPCQSNKIIAVVNPFIEFLFLKKGFLITGKISFDLNSGLAVIDFSD